MKKRMSKIIKFVKDNKYVSIILILVALVLIVAIYNNRIGIMYYMGKFLGINTEPDDKIGDAQKEIKTKPLAFTFKNWIVEVDLDDPDNPYKNVSLNNLIITGGVGVHTVKYELVYTPSSQMVYTVTDEDGNSVTHNQKVIYIVSRASRNKAMSVFNDIAKKYGYHPTTQYTGGDFEKNIDNNKYRLEISLFDVSFYIYENNNWANNCQHQFLTNIYSCTMDSGNIDYENYIEMHGPMEKMTNDYNGIMEQFNAKGYTYRYFIAQVKD